MEESQKGLFQGMSGWVLWTVVAIDFYRLGGLARGVSLYIQNFTAQGVAFLLFPLVVESLLHATRLRSLSFRFIYERRSTLSLAYSLGFLSTSWSRYRTIQLEGLMVFSGKLSLTLQECFLISASWCCRILSNRWWPSSGDALDSNCSTFSLRLSNTKSASETIN